MAENRVTVGDKEGVIVRSVKTTDGYEYIVRVPDDQGSLEDATPAVDPHALVLDGHGNTTALSNPERFEGLTVDSAIEKTEELRGEAEADAKRREERREERLREVAGEAAVDTQDDRDKAAAAAKREEGDADRGEKLLSGDAGDAPASQKQTGDDKPLTKAPARKAAGSR